MTKSKAPTFKFPMPDTLRRLLRQFENSKEAKSFIVTPPATPGLVHSFAQPYLCISDANVTTATPSLELATLCCALHAAFSNYYAHREIALTVDSDEDLEEDPEVEALRYENHLVNGIQHMGFDETGSITKIRLEKQFGVLTAIGVFPLGTDEYLQNCIRGIEGVKYRRETAVELMEEALAQTF